MTSNKLFLTVVLLLTSTLASATQIFVDLNATGANDGTSWADAFIEIQNALDASIDGDDIWVAQGTYKPPTIYGYQFEKDDIGFYGGFNGTETSVDQRDYQNQVVTLSGDIGVVGSNVDNAYSVIRTFQIDNLHIDGFVVEDGNANGVPTTGDYDTEEGGGAFIEGTVSIENCIFRNNMANTFGGAISVSSHLSNKGDLDLKNVRFIDNHAGFSAGAVNYYCNTTNSTTSNCTFKYNSCGGWAGNSNYSGGAIAFTTGTDGAVPPYSSDYYVIIEHCKFLSNYSDRYGGAISNSGKMKISNCLISNNSAEAEGAWLRSYAYRNAITIIENCTAVDNHSLSTIVKSGYYTEPNSSTSYELEVYNSIFWNPDLNDEFTLYNGSSFSFFNNIATAPISFANTTGVVNMQNNSTQYPEFINYVNGNFHLQSTSYAIGAGDNNYVTSPTDLDDNQRIEITVDVGCYEVPIVIVPAGKSFVAQETNGKGDYNKDRIVDSTDLIICLGEFGCSKSCTTDLSSDNKTSSDDLLIFLSLFGRKY